MTMFRITVAVVVAALGLASSRLWAANQRLERRLAAAGSCEPRNSPSAPPTIAGSSAPSLPIRAIHRDAPPAAAVVEQDAGEPAPPADASPAQALATHKAEIGALLSRGDGETDDQYRERVVPVVEAALTGPRQELASRRTEL